MTTIIIKDKTIYTDTRYVVGNFIGTLGRDKFIVSKEKGIAIAGAGVINDIIDLAKAVIEAKLDKHNCFGYNPPKQMRDKNDLVYLKANGEYGMIKFPYLIPCKDEFLVEGSGAGFAMGALAMGATPERAIKIASSFDIYTNDKVVKFSWS